MREFGCQRSVCRCAYSPASSAGGDHERHTPKTRSLTRLSAHVCPIRRGSRQNKQAQTWPRQRQAINTRSGAYITPTRRSVIPRARRYGSHPLGRAGIGRRSSRVWLAGQHSLDGGMPGARRCRDTSSRMHLRSAVPLTGTCWRLMTVGRHSRGLSSAGLFSRSSCGPPAWCQPPRDRCRWLASSCDPPRSACLSRPGKIQHRALRERWIHNTN